jgi:hypothetical protein
MFEKLVRWTPKGVYKWEQTRQAGRKRYVWRIGVLGWGGLMFLVMTPFFYIQQYGATWPSAENLLGSVILVLASAAIWLIGGYWFGSTMWSTMERAYREYRGESPHG